MSLSEKVEFIETFKKRTKRFVLDTIFFIENFQKQLRSKNSF